MDVIAGKWKIAIVYHLMEGPLGFGALTRKIPWCSERVLSQHLRELCEDGLLLRKSLGGNPPRVEYSLTEHGRELAPALSELMRWGDRHVARSQTILDSP